MRCYFRGCSQFCRGFGLLLWGLSLQVSAGEYGHYHPERLVTIYKAHTCSQIDFAYLDSWLADLAAHTQAAPSGFDTRDERQRVMADLQVLESIVGLAVLEQGTTALLKRYALLATIGYPLGVRGAAERAELAFNRWLLQSPEDGDALYRYGQFLLASGHHKRATFYLDKAFRHGVLEAELPLAMALLRSGEPQQADEHLRQDPRCRALGRCGNFGQQHTARPRSQPSLPGKPSRLHRRRRPGNPDRRPRVP